MSSYQARLDAASEFLLQSPPGEVNDVYQDVRNIVGDDDQFEIGILPALERYNTEQLVVVSLEGKNVLITNASRLEGQKDGSEERHIDPRSRVSFLFDHTRAVASDPQPIQTDPETEEIRAELEKLVTPYVSNHYYDGACAVYALKDSNYPAPEPEPEPVPVEVAAAEEEEEAEVVKPVEVEEEGDKMEVEEGNEKVEGEGDDKPREEEEEVKEPEAEVEVSEPIPPPPPAKIEPPPVRSRIFGIYFVGNKYNASNYLTGRWRSVYTVDLAKGTLVGTVSIAVHYYENGNVQLSTTLSTSSPLPTPPTATSIIALIKSSEQTTQTKLGETYSKLSDEGFKGLRRALPRTRSKLDWAKIAAYKLGTELGGAVPTEV